MQLNVDSLLSNQLMQLNYVFCSRFSFHAFTVQSIFIIIVFIRCNQSQHLVIKAVLSNVIL